MIQFKRCYNLFRSSSPVTTNPFFLFIFPFRLKMKIYVTITMPLHCQLHNERIMYGIIEIVVQLQLQNERRV